MDPQGSKEKAQQGLALLKDAILEVMRARPDGVSNAEICDVLDIRSDYGGGQKDFLSWSVLGLLLNEGRVRRTGERQSTKYFIVET
jgi:uncharacterized protein